MTYCHKVLVKLGLWVELAYLKMACGKTSRKKSLKQLVMSHQARNKTRCRDLDIMIRNTSIIIVRFQLREATIGA